MRLTTRVLLLLVFAAGSCVGEVGFKTFRGAWFTVRYPGTFTVKAREPGATSRHKGPDGVSFLSPDGLVEFYVYSPQWRGECQWVKKRAGEKTVSTSKQTSGHHTIIYVTLQGPGYTRSYADNRDTQADTRWVFGYRYKNQSAYHRYRPLYLKFKSSLQQFAD